MKKNIRNDFIKKKKKKKVSIIIALLFVVSVNNFPNSGTQFVNIYIIFN